ncbi:MAG: hypothetical protein JW925_13370 [Syntrophaceae bacterium]|nr:hypothetical protein [Syntrophaceae bacterium]
MEINEYNLVSSNTNEAEVIKDVEMFEGLIKQVKYASTKYSFKYFIPVEERVSEEITGDNKRFIMGRYQLVTRDMSLKAVTDAFESILNRKVKLERTDTEIKMIFNGAGIRISSSNALGMYSKNDDKMLVWKNGECKFDIVFQLNVEGKTPLLGYIKNTTESPQKTNEEINEIKYASPALPKEFQAFQDDADILRLRHIKYYGNLLEKFKDKTGKYPFEGMEKVPVYVFIENDMQEKYNKGHDPNPHAVKNLSEFFREIEDKLGEKIKQYYDPQYAPDKKPNYYMYMIRGDQYFFAVHISKYYGFSRKVSDNYYKVEISNFSHEGQRILTYSDLVKNKQFNEAINKEVWKKDFFKQRELKYINYIK